MADPHWTSYVGMATGVFGAIMGFVSYRKANEIKSLDLRLELKKSVNDFNSSLSKIKDLMSYANASRERVAAATGNTGSGSMQIWKKQYEKDQLEIKELYDTAVKVNTNFENMSSKQLEDNLVNLHELQNQANELTSRYNAALEEDSKERERIKNRHGI